MPHKSISFRLQDLCFCLLASWPHVLQCIKLPVINFHPRHLSWSGASVIIIACKLLYLWLIDRHYYINWSQGATSRQSRYVSGVRTVYLQSSESLPRVLIFILKMWAETDSVRWMLAQKIIRLASAKLCQVFPLCNSVRPCGEWCSWTLDLTVEKPPRNLIPHQESTPYLKNMSGIVRVAGFCYHVIMKTLMLWSMNFQNVVRYGRTSHLSLPSEWQTDGVLDECRHKADQKTTTGVVTVAPCTSNLQLHVMMSQRHHAVPLENILKILGLRSFIRLSSNSIRRWLHVHLILVSILLQNYYVFSAYS